MPKARSCPHIPHHCLRCRRDIKLICWLRDTREGREVRSLCPATGLSWRGSTLGAASFASERTPNISDADNRSHAGRRGGGSGTASESKYPVRSSTSQRKMRGREHLHRHLHVSRCYSALSTTPLQLAHTPARAHTHTVALVSG